MSSLNNKVTHPSLTINWMSSKLKIYPSLFYIAGAIGLLSVFQPSLGQFAMLFWLGSIVSYLAHGYLQIWAAQKYNVRTLVSIFLLLDFIVKGVNCPSMPRKTFGLLLWG